MRVAETFISINGEGTRAGELAVFIRFQGCNLRCGYCDTMWANERDCPYEEMRPEEICAYVEKTGVTNCTLTGGEPLLQDRGDMLRLIALLIDRCGCRVEIETNGAMDLTPYTLDPQHRPVFTMDYKLPSSGCERRMSLTNMALLGHEDTVKFVAGSRADLERAREIMEEYHLTDRCHVYYSPIFGAIEPAEIVDYMRERNMNKVRLQIQMHKVIWDPDRRGV